MKNHSSFAPMSVVIPCFNAHDFLERAVDSVISQSLIPAQLILIDDASTDGGRTVALIASIVESMASKKNGISVQALYLPKNCGPGGARNAGWNISTQEWIAFLDADDAWHPNKIAMQYQILKKEKDIDLLAHQSLFINSSAKNIPGISSCNSIGIVKVNLGMMLVSNLLPTRSVVLRRSIPLRFPEMTNLSEDYSLWLHIIAAGFKVRLMKCYLAYTFRPEYSIGGYSGQLWTHEKRELNTLRLFFVEKHIKFHTFALASIWSILKFMLRVIKVKFISLH